jgi:hypothetical protein
VWGVDGNIGGIGGRAVRPGSHRRDEGHRALGGPPPSRLHERLDGAYEGGVGGVYAYGAETYDAIIITALAAVVAGSDDPNVASPRDQRRHQGRQKCTDFASCIGAHRSDGVDIDYDGLGGPYEFVDAGEPAAASYASRTYDGGETPNTDLDEYVFAS